MANHLRRASPSWIPAQSEPLASLAADTTTLSNMQYTYAIHDRKRHKHTAQLEQTNYPAQNP